MSRSRLSVALVALGATGIALLSPVAAHAEDGTCPQEVEDAKAAHQAAVENGTAGSSFMGPKELMLGLANGYGSSGMPTPPDCVAEHEKEVENQKWDEMPDFVQFLRPGTATAEGIAWAGAILGLGAAAVQGLALIAKSDPSILEPLRAALKQAGIQL
ncbi:MULTISPECIES: hypothetical protein [Corynebacterium]|uniref:hypothetical protein n=1 Tax=Corynebacterium TaxID=1716 RepID=UPI00257C7074|nr:MULTISPECIES: hypothetical protein [Corynebacterium]